MSIESILVNLGLLKQRLTLQAAVNLDVSDGLASKAASVDPASVFENGKFRSTTVSLGMDQRVGTKPVLGPPTITSGQILLDGLQNPYFNINFQIDRQSVDAGSIVSFKIYRKKVAAVDLAQNVEAFNKADFDMISNGTTKSGKFSADKKAKYTVDPSLQPQVTSNTNLFDLQQTSNSQALATSLAAGSQPDFFAPVQQQLDSDFLQIGEVNYSDFLAQQKLKQVYAVDNKTISLSFSDHKVTYGSGYLYAVSSFCSTSEESAKSSALSVVILNLNGINKPQSMLVKQVNETKFQITATFKPSDYVKNVFLFRRPSDEVVFTSLGAFPNTNNMFRAEDNNVIYLKTYTYRIVLENVFGAISEPEEITVTCSSQKIISKTRSHNLAIPILLASQDQNSDGIRITIFPNDPNVLYYNLQRRDLTIVQRGFDVPGNRNGEFWNGNQFTVQTQKPQVTSTGSIGNLAQGSLPAQSDFVKFALPISFVDSYVTPGHYYQYRTVGRDLFGNQTSYAFASLVASSKSELRTPVNVHFEILRQTPFRLRLAWDDDNVSALSAQDDDAEQRYLEITLKAANLNAEQSAAIEALLLDPNIGKLDLTSQLSQFNLQKEQIAALQNQLDNLSKVSNPIKYRVQRRKVGETQYSTFSLTTNSFVIDEVATADAVPFSTGTVVSDLFKPLSSSLPTGTDSQRAFGVPPFLVSQQTYEYRVAAVSVDQRSSDYSDPQSILCQADMSPPINVVASALNPRVEPSVVQMVWSVDPLRARPDYWRIERKTDVPSDAFVVIGNAYLDSEFFDRSAKSGNQYVYRIRSVSATGVESDSVQVSIAI